MSEPIDEMLLQDLREHGCTAPTLGGEILLHIDQVVKGNYTGISAAAREHLDGCATCQTEVANARRAFAAAKPALDAMAEMLKRKRGTQ